MSANAPAAIYSLWNAVHKALPTSELSGIVGDVNHSFGYHLCRNDLPGNDYSVTLPKDKLGSPANASALDVKLPPDLMIVVTRRLYAAAKAKDPRLAALREFCGTTDGIHTHPFDLSNGQDGPLDSWDSSHLWHIHLSFYREFSDNAAALAPIADVMAGVVPPPPTTGGLSMSDIQIILAKLAELEKKVTDLETRFVGSDGHSHTIESTVAHVTKSLPYLSRKGQSY